MGRCRNLSQGVPWWLEGTSRSITMAERTPERRVVGGVPEYSNVWPDWRTAAGTTRVARLERRRFDSVRL